MTVNEKLPEGDKIRLVAIPAAPSGEGSVFEKNLEMYDKAVLEAETAGIMVLDCRYGEDTGFVIPAITIPVAGGSGPV
jgi:hypothetical protein